MARSGKGLKLPDSLCFRRMACSRPGRRSLEIHPLRYLVRKAGDSLERRPQAEREESWKCFQGFRRSGNVAPMLLKFEAVLQLVGSVLLLGIHLALEWPGTVKSAPGLEFGN